MRRSRLGEHWRRWSLALGLVSACVGESDVRHEQGEEDEADVEVSTQREGLTNTACHLSYLPAYNPQFQSALDRIRRSGNPTDFAMDGTANLATFTCNGGIVASVTKVDLGSPIELLADDYHFDTSTPYAFGRYTQGCLALDGSAGQQSMGQGGNGCNTRGYAADGLARYFSTHYGDWPTHTAASQPLVISAKTGDGLVSPFNLSQIRVRSGAVDVYTSADGKKWKRVARRVTGTAALSVAHANMAMITSAGAGTTPNYGAAPAAIDEIVMDWDAPTVTVVGPFTRLLNLAYAPPGASSHVDYTQASRTGSSTEIKTSNGNSVDWAVEAEVFAGASSDLKFTHAESRGKTTEDQFTNSTTYSIASNTDLPDHGSDRFYVWTNAAVEHTAYHDGRAPLDRVVVFQNATPHVEMVTAEQLAGTVSIPPYLDLSQLSSDQRAELLALDPFISPTFGPESMPQRFAPLGTYELLSNSDPAASGDSVTYTLEWDHQDDETKGYTDTTEVNAAIKGKVSFWGVGGTIGEGFGYTYEYERNDTHSSGTTTTASLTLASPERCRHMGIKVYLDTMFNTYAFSGPQPLLNGAPAGHTCAKTVCPEFPSSQDNTCECHADTQCPLSGACDVGNTWLCRPIVQSWNFEHTNSTVPFYIDPSFGKALGPLTISTQQGYEGSGSQALAVKFARFLGLRVSVLNGSAIRDLTGKRLRARVMIDGPAYAVSNDDYMSANIKTTVGDVSDIGEVQNLKPGEWGTLDVPIANTNGSAGDLTHSTEIYFRVFLYDTPANWTGNAYFDTIEIY